MLMYLQNKLQCKILYIYIYIYMKKYEKMPTLKKFISNVHRELKLQLENYPTHVRETALSLVMATFGKTRFCNHLPFSQVVYDTK